MPTTLFLFGLERDGAMGKTLVDASVETWGDRPMHQRRLPRLLNCCLEDALGLKLLDELFQVASFGAGSEAAGSLWFWLALLRLFSASVKRTLTDVDDLWMRWRSVPLLIPLSASLALRVPMASYLHNLVL